jgi:putative transposase
MDPDIVMPDFHRKPNRLGPESYLGRHAYFLTLCAHERSKILANAVLVESVLPVLRTTCGSHSFNVNAYCFMPDHLHLVAIGESDTASLPRLMQAFKSLAARESRKLGIVNLWQKGFYDHVLRDGESIDAAAAYAFLNPVRAGLVWRAEEWPYSGSFMFAWPNVPVVSRPFVPPWKREAQKEPEKSKMAR